uniref:C2 domain-containing protein n=1 Tax=Laticauda laticaudata TaxID=8630 RepID=A0A8C5RVF5_LATLA
MIALLTHQSMPTLFTLLNRATIQKNVELIRLQKLLWEKNSELVISKAQITALHEAPFFFSCLHQNQEALRSASEAMLAQLDDLNANLKEKTQKVTMLESRLEILLPLRGTLDEFQHILFSFCFCPFLSFFLPSSFPYLPSFPSPSFLSLSFSLPPSLPHSFLSSFLSSFLPSFLLSFLPFFPLPSLLSFCSLSPSLPPSLPPSQSLSAEVPERDQEKIEIFIQDSLKRQLHEAEAAHAETVLELEKTRNMVILQHRINCDYQVELEKVLMQSRQEKQEHEDQQRQMDQLLHLRNARVHQLEGVHILFYCSFLEKLKDVANGTRAVQLRPLNSDVDDEGVPSKVMKLQHGENLFELHISGAILSAEAIQLLGDPELLTFCTYAFYDFETHCTPLARGVRPHYNFTSQYVVQVDPFFMQYLQGATSRLDLHLASAVDHTTLASCWLHFGQVLNNAEQVHYTAVLHGPKGENYGLLEYGLKLHFPFKHISQLPHCQSQTLTRINRNELCIQIKSCANLRSHWIGSQPSPYAMYQFFTFPDHDTPITRSSNHPDFEDVKKFALHITPELHHYLLVESLWVYVFDDEEEEPGSYLGKAQIPLVPLAHGHSIKGNFDLMDPARKPNGSIHLSLEWKALYLPPENVRYKAIQAHSLEMQIADEQNLLHRQVWQTSIRWKRVACMCKGNLYLQEQGPSFLDNKRNYSIVKHTIFFLSSLSADGEEQEVSESQTTESDEVVVVLPTQGYPDLVKWIRVEVISLGLLPESWPAADETIQQLYVEFHFPGVPLEETETAFSLRKPRGTEEIYFHFSKVIKLDADPKSFQRQMLLSMLVAEDPERNKLQFIVVSEPLPGASGECEDVGFSSVDLREILLTGNDIFEQDLQGKMISSLSSKNWKQAAYKFLPGIG